MSHALALTEIFKALLGKAIVQLRIIALPWGVIFGGGVCISIVDRGAFAFGQEGVFLIGYLLLERGRVLQLHLLVCLVAEFVLVLILSHDFHHPSLLSWVQLAKCLDVKDTITIDGRGCKEMV